MRRGLYSRTYSAAEVAASVCRFTPSRHRPPDCQGEWTRRLEHYPGRWARRTVAVADLRMSTPFTTKPCTAWDIAPYVQRRRRGARFPPIVLAPPYGNDPRWRVWDGNHRSRSAQCAGDREIDAYAPTGRPGRPRGRELGRRRPR